MTWWQYAAYGVILALGGAFVWAAGHALRDVWRIVK